MRFLGTVASKLITQFDDLKLVPVRIGERRNYAEPFVMGRLDALGSKLLEARRAFRN